MSQAKEKFYEAMRKRDPHFDGKFFIGVKTTGIYCRPICPAKPKRENIEFFKSAREAEAAGYRACLRCRPETTPFSAAWIGKSAVVRRAIKILIGSKNFEFKEDLFARRFGLTARHLRRLFIEELGKTAKQIHSERRFVYAKKLVLQSTAPFSEIAFASGFKSIRRFNDTFKKYLKKSPTQLRQQSTKEKKL